MCLKLHAPTLDKVAAPALGLPGNLETAYRAVLGVLVLNFSNCTQTRAVDRTAGACS